MKKILLTLATVVCFFAESQSVYAQSVTDDLVGLGMRPEIAEYIAAILPAGSVVGNNTYIKGRNAANSADISMLKVDATDDTVLNADSGDIIKLSVAGTSEVEITGDKITYTVVTAGSPALSTGSVDGADSNLLNLLSYGGATGDAGRGSYLALNGNEVATVGGFVQAVLGGAASNFTVTGATGTTVLLDIEDNGDISTFATDVVISPQDKTMQVLAGATLDADVTTASTVTTSVAYMGSNTTAGSNFNLIANIASATTAANINLFKTRAAANSWDANTVVSSGDDLGSITAYSADGAAYGTAAQILFEAAAASGSGDTPGSIAFKTSPDASSTLATDLTITNNLIAVAAGTVLNGGAGSWGWTLVNATDNQACTTGCGISACIFGFDSGAATLAGILACSDATADLCFCTGAAA